MVRPLFILFSPYVMQFGENPMVHWESNSSTVVRIWERPTQGIHILLLEKPVLGYSIDAKLHVRFLTVW
jgi:hypothetical protein